ncbi:endolysin [Arthrobacter phage Lymara]|uniref:Endolysin n=1 Tax=Arthrobacter phage Lymara TaxID=2599828 RepID=A0A5J6TY42_9CAUD|nr:endolysin [Arthrobacter phage Lymara]QFG14869.1 endolysin [Arthrobacter phage Lymara]
MTKRQYLVTFDVPEDMDPERLDSHMADLLFNAKVERLADTVGGFPAIWDANAPQGTVMVFQADQREPIGHITPQPSAERFTGRDNSPTPEQWDQLRERVKDMVRGNPWGHVEVMQPDGTMAPPPVPGAILGTGGWVVQDPPPARKGSDALNLPACVNCHNMILTFEDHAQNCTTRQGAYQLPTLTPGFLQPKDSDNG